ncbi:UNVERIFIED_CONTAM: Phosphatidate phosphatase PAH1 [Sesamum radiatum]|uniref:Phosphatidate phosphatase PAH1 n=1 Tax=Sesamum radiatum TaxID=300843 RepID=A0AAW2NM82_SESRA
MGQLPIYAFGWKRLDSLRDSSSLLCNKGKWYQLFISECTCNCSSYLTKSFLFNLKQDGKSLPSGPVVISPDGLFPSLFREGYQGALPPDYNPFYAGFGNRDTDELSYRKIGIPKGKIFIINPKEDYNSWNYWKMPLPDID